MSCSGTPKTLLTCIAAVCDAAQSVVLQIATVRAWIAALISTIRASQSTISCVIDGPVGGTCTTPLGGTLPTLATRLDGLNAASVASITQEAAVATAGQTVWTLSSAADFVDVAVNGAPLLLYQDFAVSGADVILAAPLAAGDQLSAWRYQL